MKNWEKMLGEKIFCKYHRLLACIVAVIMLVTSFATINTAHVFGETPGLSVEDLQTNSMVNPLGIDQDVYFGWKLKSDLRGTTQTSYAIQVSKNEDMSEPFWQVEEESDQSVYVPFTGNLDAATRYYWRVTVTDNQNRTATSETAWFETGLLDGFSADTKWIKANDAVEELNYDLSSYTVEADLKLPSTSEFSSDVYGGIGIIPKGNHRIALRINREKPMYQVITWKDNGVDNGAETLLDGIYKSDEFNRLKIVVDVEAGELTPYVNGDEGETRKYDFDLSLQSVGLYFTPGYGYGYYDNFLLTDANGLVIESEDFSENSGAFSNGSLQNGGSYRFDGTLNGNNIEDDMFVPTLEKPSSDTVYDIEVDFRIWQNSAAVIFAYDGNNAYLRWEFREQGDTIYFQPLAWRTTSVSTVGGKGELALPLEAINESPTASQHLKISVCGTEIRTWLNGVLIDTSTDSVTKYGMVGFKQTENTSAYYDNLQITTPGADGSKNTTFADDFEQSVTLMSGGELRNGEYFLDCATGEAIASTPKTDSSPWFRKDFSTEKTVVSARIYATALGIYELYLNGERVGDQLLAPGYTDYSTNIRYQTYDVTEMICKGKNVIGAWLGNGWFAGRNTRGTYGDGPLSFYAQLNITYNDGSVEIIGTDTTWKTVANTAILSNQFWDGEIFDARLLEDFTAPNYDDGEWKESLESDSFENIHSWLPDVSEPTLLAQNNQPVTVSQRLTPKSITKVADDVWILDIGQFISGFVEMRVHGGNAGSMIRLRYAQELNPDGSIYTANLRSAKATDYYIKQGDGDETYQPRFTSHGFRYVEITGYPQVPTIEDFTGLAISNQVVRTSSFETSNADLNRLYENVVWSQQNSYLSIGQADGSRDERWGWLDVIQECIRTAAYNFNVDQLYSKIMDDIVFAQYPDGRFPDVTPPVGPDGAGNYGLITQGGNVGWADSGIILPVVLYERFGNIALLDRYYDNMVEHMNYISKKADGYLMPDEHSYRGDWEEYGVDHSDTTANHLTPYDLLNTAFYAFDTLMMERAAQILEREADALKYERLYQNIRTAYIESFIDGNGKVKGDTQGAYAITLYFNLVPEEKVDAVVENFVAVIEKDGFHPTTGFVTTPYLLPALAQYGQAEVAYKLLLQDTFPSWGYMVKQGATTMWESYEGISPDGTFGDPNMNTNDLPNFGSIGEWMINGIGGIQSEDVAFHNFVLEPNPTQQLEYAKVVYDSPYGTIESNWKNVENGIEYQFSVPANTVARLRLEVSDTQEITFLDEDASDYVTDLGIQNGRREFLLASGDYQIAVTEKDEDTEKDKDTELDPDTGDKPTTSKGCGGYISSFSLSGMLFLAVGLAFVVKRV